MESPESTWERENSLDIMRTMLSAFARIHNSYNGTSQSVQLTPNSQKLKSQLLYKDGNTKHSMWLFRIP